MNSSAYEDEVIDTGIEEIDNELIGDDYDGTSESGSINNYWSCTTSVCCWNGSYCQASTSLVNDGVRFHKAY